MDTIKFDNSYANLPETFFVRQNADAAPDPALIALNEDLAADLGIGPSFPLSKAGLAMFSGRAMPDGAAPLAMAYAGHQFGGWSPQLGDGRALLLGEVIAPDGTRFDIQLKGAGRTPFSRGGDGKSAIGPVIREYIVSEAMAALGVPTTRALAAMTTGETVIREGILPGAIFTRVARSHVRVGTFQYFAARDDVSALRTLADYVIDRHYPNARQEENPVKAMFAEILTRQAKLIALWQKFGFIHGVMNTDNMQVAGETIDYGPCAFMDDFNADKVFSSIDRGGRYAWGRQPQLAQWNLARLGESLQAIWDTDEDTWMSDVKAMLNDFADQYTADFAEAFSQKLGLPVSGQDNREFIGKTLDTMSEQEADFTLFFSCLRRIEQPNYRTKFIALFADGSVAEDWLVLWGSAKTESGIAPELSQKLLDTANPIYIPRNHQVEATIQAGIKGDYAPMHRLHEVLKNPFEEQTDAAGYEIAPKVDELVQQTFCGT